jgi:hypothetical protein
MNRQLHHKGYAVAAAAQRMQNGLFAANLTIERRVNVGGVKPNEPYSFHALDYFHDEEGALDYATRWGLIWIDDRG